MIYKLRIGIFLIALCALVLELSLVRVFDVILTPNMGYAVVTSAIFALGLGGIYLYIVPLKRELAVKLIPWLFIVFALSTLALLPSFNSLPFKLNLGAAGDVRNLGNAEMGSQIIAWLSMYLILIMPFFIAGLIISIILTHYSEQVHSLYFFDLIGAGIGCLVLFPLITPYGPGGVQFLVAGLALIGTLLFFDQLKVKSLLLVLSLALIIYPATRDEYLEFAGHSNKRGVDDLTEQGLRDYVKWGSVSKLDVVKTDDKNLLNFAIDGGQQGSWLQGFDGNYSSYHNTIKNNPETYYFGMNSVAHYFKQGTQPNVLIIGAAVGGETKAAVLFGAEHVDSIELVNTMVEAAKTRYDEFAGGVFNHPKVNYRVDEGRTFLRSSNKEYDIIQMFSNHTTSSIANGSGAVGAAYLQTVEAYKEYFTHLSENGMMQINHHVYPRILTSAAEAWRQLGKEDFSRHVLVIERWVPDTLPATFIKMQPWTSEEVAKILQYMNREQKDRGLPNTHRGTTDPIYKDHPVEFKVIAKQLPIRDFSVFVSADGQSQVDHDLNLKVYDGDHEIADQIIPADTIGDMQIVAVRINPIRKVENNPLRVVLSSESPKAEAVSLWLAERNRPHASFRGVPTPFVVAFDPVEQQYNLLPSELLDGEFDQAIADQAAYILDPVTDNNPYFGMLRKTLGSVSRFESPYMDYGTEYFLNVQQLPFLTADLLNLFIVAVIAIAFSLVFIFLPLFFSKHGRARWPGMASFLIYFCCLGAGFILIELTLIQLFKKLIGFPTHTYATVLFALLISAGLGSLASKPLGIEHNNRWKIVFSLIIATCALFIFTYEWWFSIFLQHPLWIRLLAATAMLFPMGFLMGMPFPVAISRLGAIESGGIPWAWAMNGFFTVFGGFLSILMAFTLGFQVTLLVGASIYLLAFYMYARINRVAIN